MANKDKDKDKGKNKEKKDTWLCDKCPFETADYGEYKKHLMSHGTGTR